MLGKPGLVDRIRAVVELVAVNVDLDQIGRGNFAEMETERVDEERILLARHLQGDMIINHLVPAKMRENAVTGGELLARAGFFMGPVRTALVSHFSLHINIVDNYFCHSLARDDSGGERKLCGRVCPAQFIEKTGLRLVPK